MKDQQNMQMPHHQKIKYNILEDSYFKEFTPASDEIYLDPEYTKPLNISNLAERIVLDDNGFQMPIVRKNNLEPEKEEIKSKIIFDNNPEYPYNISDDVTQKNTSQKSLNNYTDQTASNIDINNVNFKNPKVRRAMEFFMSNDRGEDKLNFNQAAGLVGNLFRESKMDENASNKASKAFGLAQWLGSRKDRLFREYGKKPTFEQQLQFIWKELKSTHLRGLRELQRSKTIEQAARNAFGYYEFSCGPEGAIMEMNKYKQDGQKAHDDGIKFAKDILNV